MQPDYTKAKACILGLMEEKLPHGLGYHRLDHTTVYVLPAAELFCQDLTLAPEKKLLVKTAALFHDSGYIKQYSDNEIIGAALAESILPACDYTPRQICSIIQIILSTTMPQQPKSMLDEILCDADLVTLGHPDFFETSMMLRREFETFQHPISLRDWLKEQYRFLKDHRYFTTAARNRLDRGKKENIIELDKVLHSTRDRQ